MSQPTPEERARWPAPNYDNPRTRAPALIAVMAVSTAAMMPFLIARIHTRRKIRGRLALDDWIIISSAMLSIASTILASYATRWGAGYHIYDIRPEWNDTYNKLGLSGVILFTISVSLPKISVCFTYLMLFPSKTNLWFCRCMIVFLTCWWLSTVLVTVLQCRPAASYWDSRILSTWCINTSVFNILTAVLNSLSDFMVYLWPVHYLWNIQLPAKQRIGLIVVFVIGCSACVAGIFRMYYIHRLFHSYEIFYDGAAIWIASSVETNIGIIFTCIHAIKPILSKLVPSLFGTVASEAIPYHSGDMLGGNSRPSRQFLRRSWQKESVSMTRSHWADGDVKMMSQSYQPHRGPKTRITGGSGRGGIPLDKIMYEREVTITGGDSDDDETTKEK